MAMYLYGERLIPCKGFGGSNMISDKWSVVTSSSEETHILFFFYCLESVDGDKFVMYVLGCLDIVITY